MPDSAANKHLSPTHRPPHHRLSMLRMIHITTWLGNSLPPQLCNGRLSATRTAAESTPAVNGRLAATGHDRYRSLRDLSSMPATPMTAPHGACLLEGARSSQHIGQDTFGSEGFHRLTNRLITQQHSLLETLCATRALAKPLALAKIEAKRPISHPSWRGSLGEGGWFQVTGSRM